MTGPANTMPAPNGAGGRLPAGIRALAVVVVRDGQLPAGAGETVAEAGGAALVVGSGTREAAGGLDSANRVWVLERSSVGPAALADTLAPVVSGVEDRKSTRPNSSHL